MKINKLSVFTFRYKQTNALREQRISIDFSAKMTTVEIRDVLMLLFKVRIDSVFASNYPYSSQLSFSVTSTNS